MLYAILKPIAVVLMRLLFRLEAVGRELVPATGPVLIVSNHVSVLDPPLVGGSVPRPVYFMAKEELFRIPLFGRLIRSLNARPVRRDGSDMRALKGSLRPAAGGPRDPGVSGRARGAWRASRCAPAGPGWGCSRC